MQVAELLIVEDSQGSSIPFYTMSVSAGFPTDIGEPVDEIVDLNDFLIEHPASTFFAKVIGDSLNNIGIKENDIIIFDTAEIPKDGKIVLINYNNDLSIKVYRNTQGKEYLQSENNTFIPFNVNPLIDFNILGVVTKVIHPV